MPVNIKTPDEQEAMRRAGRLAASVLEMIAPHVKAGVSTEEIDRRCHEFIVNELDAIPAPLNYRGFPKSVCTSVNHVVCHGIPGPKQLKNGDIINVDVTVIKDGFHGDTSEMFYIGEPPVRARRLSEVAREAMVAGIKAVRPGLRLGDLGAIIQQVAESQRFSVVREYCGHGIGREFHEDPQILHYGRQGEGMELAPGMCFTIEPMINAGRREVKLLADNWTVVTRDRSLSAQWEHTVLVTDDGYEVLTQREGEII